MAPDRPGRPCRPGRGMAPGRPGRRSRWAFPRGSGSSRPPYGSSCAHGILRRSSRRGACGLCFRVAHAAAYCVPCWTGRGISVLVLLRLGAAGAHFGAAGAHFAWWVLSLALRAPRAGAAPLAQGHRPARRGGRRAVLVPPPLCASSARPPAAPGVRALVLCSSLRPACFLPLGMGRGRAARHTIRRRSSPLVGGWSRLRGSRDST
eukprot:gene19266-biopygen16035